MEDERIIALDLRGALEQLGYAVVGTAASAEDAIAKAAHTAPDLVLMDIRLGGPMDGIEAATVIRARHGLPIVYLSANTDIDTLQRALESAPSGYLTKPYNSACIHATIEVALRRHRAEALLSEENAELGQLTRRLRNDAIIDGLTGLFNRRHFDAVLRHELTIAARRDGRVGLILLDLDHFKAVNDSFGHQAGDEVLRTVAALVRSELRPTDIPCRFGGEELAVVVPNVSLSDACAVSERLRIGIEALAIHDISDEPIVVTASFGVAAFPDQHGPQELLRAADAALYEAKGSGRNRVCGAAVRAAARLRLAK